MSFMPAVAGFPRPYIAPPEAGAAAWSDVKLLVSAEGRPAGSLTYGNIADAPVIAVQGSQQPYVITTTSPFPGGQSFQMGVYNNRRVGIRVAGSAASLATGVFTLEGWAYVTSALPGGGVPRPIASAYLGTGGNSWDLRYNHTGSTMEFRYFDGGGVQTIVPFAHSASFALPPPLTWFHWCIERDASGFVRVYIDGAMVVKVSAPSFLATTGKHFWIGTTNNGGLSDDNWPDGAMAEIRLTKAALYASDAGFIPRSTAFPRGAAGLGDPHWASVRYLSQDHTDDTGVSFSGLIHRGENSGVFSNATAMSISTADQRGARVGDWLFGGTGFDTRSVTGAQADVFNFWNRTVPFAVEAFIRPNSTALSGAGKNILGVWGGNGKKQWLLNLNAGRPSIILSTDGTASTSVIATAALAVDTWHHIVLTRNASAVYRIFVNGALVVTLDSLTGTDLFNVPAGGVELRIGSSYGGQNSFSGHGHGLRITHGVDRYFDTDGFIGEWPENVDQFPAYAAVAT